jgi:hypothetical protein
VLTTALAVLAAIALLLPGFLVAEVGNARGARSSRSDLELALRALFYALVIHLLFAWWTVDVFDRTDVGHEWRHHARALVFYAAIVLVLVPLLLGTLLNALLERVERREGPTPLWAAALGAGQARDAYDFAFQRVHAQGAWVIVELIDHAPDDPRLIAGRYGRGSAVGQTPSAHDLYLEQLCVVHEHDGIREISHTITPARGVYVPAQQVARIEILPPDADTMPS